MNGSAFPPRDDGSTPCDPGAHDFELIEGAPNELGGRPRRFSACRRCGVLEVLVPDLRLDPDGAYRWATRHRPARFAVLLDAERAQRLGPEQLVRLFADPDLDTDFTVLAKQQVLEHETPVLARALRRELGLSPRGAVGAGENRRPVRPGPTRILEWLEFRARRFARGEAARDPEDDVQSAGRHALQTLAGSIFGASRDERTTTPSTPTLLAARQAVARWLTPPPAERRSSASPAIALEGNDYRHLARAASTAAAVEDMETLELLRSVYEARIAAHDFGLVSRRGALARFRRSGDGHLLCVLVERGEAWIEDAEGERRSKVNPDLEALIAELDGLEKDRARGPYR